MFKALSLAGLTSGMTTQQPIILRLTIPDFMWSGKRKAVYLDGVQVHSKGKIQERDAEIDELLELKGWSVLRLPYTPPLTDGALTDIIVRVKKFLNWDEEAEKP